MRNLEPETGFQQFIIDLAKLSGWRWYHTHTSRHSASGFPDLILVRPPRLLAWELKADGKDPTKPQQEWLDAVNWAVIATIQAWEFGIDSSNVDEFLGVDPEEDPEVARFLGIDDFDAGLGLDPDFAVNILQQVGNYQEIYERTVGPDTTLGLEAEQNNLWTEGGLLYAPPYR
jgi:hypothetical protein